VGRRSESKDVEKGFAVGATLLLSEATEDGGVAEDFPVGRKVTDGDPNEWIEPMEGEDEVRRGADQRIAPLDMGQLVEEDVAEFGVVKRFEKRSRKEDFRFQNTEDGGGTQSIDDSHTRGIREFEEILAFINEAEDTAIPALRLASGPTTEAQIPCDVEEKAQGNASEPGVINDEWNRWKTARGRIWGGRLLREQAWSFGENRRERDGHWLGSIVPERRFGRLAFRSDLGDIGHRIRG
jgi:hypothetical protein